MNIIFNLDDNEEAKLKELAAQRGLSSAECAREIVLKALKESGAESKPRPTLEDKLKWIRGLRRGKSSGSDQD